MYSAQDFSVPALSIVVPTFNEADNVRPIYDIVQHVAAGFDWELIFVDDDSPDGTFKGVEELAQTDTRVRLIHRVGRRGLAGACIEGILSSRSPHCVVMDADLQHDANIIPEMLRQLQTDTDLDLVVGSRHVEGGCSKEGFSRVRQLGSDGATRLAKMCLGIKVTDPMSGFFMVRKESFSKIAPNLQSSGFKILMDMLAVSAGRWHVSEVGYSFQPRQHGESKLDSTVLLEFLALIVSRVFGGMVSIRFVLFAMVGLTGVALHMGVVGLLMGMSAASFGIAQAVASFLAMTSNFALNNLVTYRDMRLRGPAFVRGLFSFYAVCSVGVAVNVGAAGLVYSALENWPVAALAGILISAVWNYLASSVVTWRKE